MRNLIVAVQFALHFGSDCQEKRQIVHNSKTGKALFFPGGRLTMFAAMPVVELSAPPVLLLLYSADAADRPEALFD